MTGLLGDSVRSACEVTAASTENQFRRVEAQTPCSEIPCPFQKTLPFRQTARTPGRSHWLIGATGTTRDICSHHHRECLFRVLAQPNWSTFLGGETRNPRQDNRCSADTLFGDLYTKNA